MLIESKTPEDKKISNKFPNISADILAAGNPRVIEFFSTEQNGSLPFFDRLMSAFCRLESEAVVVEQNLTRSSYVQKVLNSLVVGKPALFLNYLLSRRLFLDALVANNLSNSIQTLIIVIIAG